MLNISIGGSKMIMQHYNLVELDILFCANPIIQLNYSSDKLGKEDNIDHRVLNHSFIETKTGLLLLLELENLKDNSMYTYSFPDIQRIEGSTQLSNFYFHSIDRSKLHEHLHNETFDYLDNAPKIVNRIIIKR